MEGIIERSVEHYDSSPGIAEMTALLTEGIIERSVEHYDSSPGIAEMTALLTEGIIERSVEHYDPGARVRVIINWKESSNAQ